MDTPCITCYEKWKYAIVVNIKEPFLKETDLFYEKFSVLSELVWGCFQGFASRRRNMCHVDDGSSHFYLGEKNNLRPSLNLFLEVPISGDLEVFFKKNSPLHYFNSFMS
jgi:hypothetical protein